jgi:hypothetical protein
MIRFDDYRQANGHVDWDAYREAQKRAGEACRRCGRRGRLIVFPKDYPTLCPECLDLDRPEAVDHAHRIRCPKCRALMNPHELEDHDLYAEGVHTVACGCGRDFDVTTTVSYTFGSPAVDPDDETA